VGKSQDLRSSVSFRTLQKIQDSFSIALGIPLSIRSLEGDLLTKMSNESHLWGLAKPTMDSDEQIQTRLKTAFQKSLRTGQVVIFERYLDTYTFASPIYVNGKIVAFFVAGLVRFGNPNLEAAESEAKRLNVSIDEFLEAYLQLALFTKQRLGAAANLLRVISVTITSYEFKENEISLKKNLILKENVKLAENLAKTSNELTKSIDKYKRMFESVNDGIYFADMEGRFSEVNLAGSKLLGFKTPEELIGKQIKDLYVNSADRDTFNSTIVKEGNIENFLARIRLPNGEERLFETNATLIKDRYGKAIGIEGIFRDINKRVHRGLQQNHATNHAPINTPQNHETQA